MAQRLKSILLSTGFIVVAAFVFRMAYCWYILGIREIAIPDKHPFGAETGAIAASIAAGRGFSSPVLGLASGPTAWLVPIYPYLLAGIFKLFGIFTFTSSVMIRFLIGDRDPVVEERVRQICRRKTRDQIPGEIDRIEFDMRDGVQ